MALDKDTGNSLFGNFKGKGKQPPSLAENVEVDQPQDDETSSPQETSEEIKKPKWETLDKVTVLLTTEQKSGLDAIAKSLMKYRSARTKGADKERLTANTILRALIDDFLEKKDSYPLEVLTSEEDVKKWIQRNS